MNLSELKIETYSDQLSEKELTEVKGGGSSNVCGVLGAIAWSPTGLAGTAWNLLTIAASQPPSGDIDIPQ